MLYAHPQSYYSFYPSGVINGSLLQNDTYQIAANIYLIIDHNRKDKQNLLSTPEKEELHLL